MQKRDKATSGIGSILVAIMLFTATSFARAETKIPSTPDEYFALAKRYHEKAETYRKEATLHREMSEAARKSPLNAHQAHGQKEPSVEKMIKHCNDIAAKADALAVENEKAADFYDLRGKELQGK
jgi:hypothetical protein